MLNSIKKVSEKFNISPSWLNDDFTKTSSYSNKLSEFSSFYKTYNEVLTIRTIKDEYLIAMKLVSGRIYKNDISDIVGILYECKKNNKTITYEMIDKSVNDLYGNWDLISNDIKGILDNALKNSNLEKLYNDVNNSEQNRKSSLLEFDNKYPEVLNDANINDILKKLKLKATRYFRMWWPKYITYYANSFTNASFIRRNTETCFFSAKVSNFC